jgi:hypothetical protein
VRRLEKSLSRREFIGAGIRSAGLCGVSALGLKSATPTLGAERSAASPFAYEVDRLSKIDPKLLHYEQVARIQGLGLEPKRIAVGPDDRLYVATRAAIEIIDPAQGKIGDIPLSSPGRCVAVAEDGTTYAGLRTHIEVFNAKRQFVAAWDPPTKKAWLTGLCVRASDVFVADSAGRVIYRYDRSGKLLGRIGEKNATRNIPGLIVPSPYLDVKLGQDGLLRINNPGRHCVHVFTPDGDLELSWGKPSLTIEGFCGCCNPVGIALLPDGRCVTTEKGMPRVKVYSTDRTLESVVAGPDLFRENGRPGQLTDQSDGTLGGLDSAVDSQGRVCIMDPVARDLRIMKRKA